MVRAFMIGLLLGILVTAGDSDEERIYTPTGKRDPLRPAIIPGGERSVASISDVERFAIEQYQLRAVLRTNAKATALFEDPNGNSHILAEGELLGRERATLSRILDREVILTVQTRNFLGSEKPYEKHMALPEK